MLISKKPILIAVSLIVSISAVSWYNVYAQNDSITPQQVDSIRANCTSLKNTLNQLHSSDTLLRVSMGQVYESMSTKLMNGFNGRVSNNHFNNSSLSSITKNYNSALDKLRLDYRTYEDKLSIAMGVDCQKNPNGFYDAVATARINRKRVHEDVSNLNQLIDQYQAAILQFESDFKAAGDGVKN